ncbi:MAG: N-acetylglucosaminyldiphosphoundecaprenol N-acetyl-beta-D-mannosaminyltransferase [Halanaerobiales bacterium]|nr:N-acetylglucosaminyldiphosphoundecaprenol N-acetyl-beta-D-mannosaminyltransferase [Halanaerobiales bacterium]
MRDQVDILGVKVNKVNMGQAKDRVVEFIEGGRQGRMIVTPNSEMIVMAREDPELRAILNQADLSVPDGAGVVLASRIFKDPVPERVAGFDLMKELFSLAVINNYSIYLLGGKPGIVETAGQKIREEFPTLNLCGSHHGYLDKRLLEEVINEINGLEPDLLFIGMGVPLQEKFLAQNLHRLKVRVAMTVGGAFDVLAGRVNRAPLWMQRMHLEWLFRLLQEPSRLGRMLALPRFVILVFWELIRKRFGG